MTERIIKFSTDPAFALMNNALRLLAAMSIRRTEQQKRIRRRILINGLEQSSQEPSMMINTAAERGPGMRRKWRGFATMAYNVVTTASGW